MSSRNPAAHFPSQTQQYGERVRNIASHWPRLDALNNFLNPNEVFGPDNCDINVLQFKRDSNEPIMFESVSATNLSRYLQAERTWSCRLFVVENISPDVIKQLGGTFDIDPEFFAEHLDEEQWYWVDGVRNVTQPLPSARMEESFFHLRSLQPRAWLKLDHDSSNAFVITEEEADYLRHDPVVCNDLRESRRRTAGVLIPLPRDGFEFEPILLTRQGLTVWFRSEDGGGWTGAIELGTIGL
jgi:hypothetical protein